MTFDPEIAVWAINHPAMTGLGLAAAILLTLAVRGPRRATEWEEQAKVQRALSSLGRHFNAIYLDDELPTPTRALVGDLLDEGWSRWVAMEATARFQGRGRRWVRVCYWLGW